MIARPTPSRLRLVPRPAWSSLVFSCLVCLGLGPLVRSAAADLAAPISVAAGRGCDGVAIGDVLAAGGNELIVANRVGWSIMVFQRSGDPVAEFACRQTIHTNWAPAVVAAADVNGDSLADLVIAHYQDYQGTGRSNSFGVCYQNAGTGRLDPEVVYRLPAGQASRAIAVGDVNSDDRPEIVVANEQVGDAVYVWGWDEGAGELRSVASLGPIRGYVVSIAIGDINGDQRADVVLYGTRMFVLSQRADGLLSGPVDHGRTGGESCAIGDLNRDGLNDVVGATAFSGEIEIWKQTPRHTLRRRERRACGQYTEDVEVADLNHDGLADVAVACRDDGALLVFYQHPSGGVGDPVVLGRQDTSWVNELAVGDLNGDGRTDLAASHWGGRQAWNPAAGTITVWYSEPAATLAGDP